MPQPHYLFVLNVLPCSFLSHLIIIFNTCLSSKQSINIVLKGWRQRKKLASQLEKVWWKTE